MPFGLFRPNCAIRGAPFLWFDADPRRHKTPGRYSAKTQKKRERYRFEADLGSRRRCVKLGGSFRFLLLFSRKRRLKSQERPIQGGRGKNREIGRERKKLGTGSDDDYPRTGKAQEQWGRRRGVWGAVAWKAGGVSAKERRKRIEQDDGGGEVLSETAGFVLSSLLFFSTLPQVCLLEWKRKKRTRK